MPSWIARVFSPGILAKPPGAPAVPGYPSIVVAVLFLGGMQLLSIGIIGEYLARMFDESKKRPLYFLKTGHCPPYRRARPNPASGQFQPLDSSVNLAAGYIERPTVQLLD